MLIPNRIPGALKYLFACYLNVLCIDSSAQTENFLAANFPRMSSVNLRDSTDLADPGNILDCIQRVDSVAHAMGLSRHFADIYCKVMKKIETQIKNIDSSSRHFAIKFENSFAAYFLTACVDDKNRCLADSSHWKCLFTHPEAKDWQLALLGVNAHANGDLWQVLVINFCETDIRQYKRQLLNFQPAIADVYYTFFNEVLTHNKYLKIVNSMTNGLAKQFGERVIYKWGLRQINLAILFYQDPVKFEKMLARVKRKKQRIDKMILAKNIFL